MHLQQAMAGQGTFLACNAATIGFESAIRLDSHLLCTKCKHFGKMCQAQIKGAGATICATVTGQCIPPFVDQVHQSHACCADTPGGLGMSETHAARCSSLSASEEHVLQCRLVQLQWITTTPVCYPPNTRPQPHASGACAHSDAREVACSPCWLTSGQRMTTGNL